MEKYTIFSTPNKDLPAFKAEGYCTFHHEEDAIKRLLVLDKSKKSFHGIAKEVYQVHPVTKEECFMFVDDYGKDGRFKYLHEFKPSEFKGLTYPNKIKAKTLKEAYFFLKDISSTCNLNSTNFKTIAYEGAYPTNEKEADVFVKSRIKLWLKTWVQDRVDIIIEDFEKDSNR